VTTTHHHASDGFGTLLERHDGRDFPYYDGEPVEVTTGRWIAIIASCAVAIIVLSLIPQPNNLVALIPRILFPVIMLVVFIALVPRFWKSIFRRIGGWDVLTMVFFAILNGIVSFIIGGIIRAVTTTTGNPATDGLRHLNPGELVSFYLGTGAQLFGEELFTILPFLGVMYWLHSSGRMSRNLAVILAWLITALWFGAAHLPTYHWNILQALLGIGVARLVLTLAYIRTKNILVSTGAHILNDWVAFTFVILGTITITI
jgi:membrane protease YdiL (CAAX protease family)